jgi:hypothetical protein
MEEMTVGIPGSEHKVEACGSARPHLFVFHSRPRMAVSFFMFFHSFFILSSAENIVKRDYSPVAMAQH